MSDAEDIAAGKRPPSWTEQQHLDAALAHGSARTDAKEKLAKARASWQRKRNATVEDEEKHRKKIAKLEAEYELHHELAQKHLAWSKKAYRQLSDYELMMKEPRKW